MRPRGNLRMSDSQPRGKHISGQRMKKLRRAAERLGEARQFGGTTDHHFHVLRSEAEKDMSAEAEAEFWNGVDRIIRGI